MFTPITALTAAVLALFQVALMLRVSARRGATQTGVGDGGDEELLRRMRAHGNLVENAPMFLILLYLTELSWRGSPFVAVIAVFFVVFRLSHALGISRSVGTSFPRFLGASGTVLCFVLLSIALVRGGVSALLGNG